VQLDWTGAFGLSVRPERLGHFLLLFAVLCLAAMKFPDPSVRSIDH
jgi:hypothetical protein